MGKYIRTKDGVYEVKGANLITKSFTIYKGKRQCFVKEKDILKQADTIEELCDFVDIQYQDGTWETYLYEKVFNLKLFFKKAKQVFYGIRTDKGLIYVAKMNDEGELELL